VGRRGGARARGSGGSYVRSASPRGRRKSGGAHTTVRGEGGGGLGQPEAKAQWGGSPVAGPGRRRSKREGGGVGLEGGRDQTQGGEMGSEPAEGQGPGGWVENQRWAQAQEEILFEFQLILEFGRTLENCTRRFRKKFAWGFFLKSSRLSKYFRKLKYAMP
jgi:hypothetical protein